MQDLSLLRLSEMPPEFLKLFERLILCIDLHIACIFMRVKSLFSD